MGDPSCGEPTILAAQWPAGPNSTRPRLWLRVAQLTRTDDLVRSVRYGARGRTLLAPGRPASALPDSPTAATWTSAQASRMRPVRSTTFPMTFPRLQKRTDYREPRA